MNTESNASKYIVNPIVILFALGFIPAAVAQEATDGAVSSSDTAFVLICAAAVLLMTPALAFFYGGLVRKKNFLSVLMQCFFIICLITIQWILWGYSLASGPGELIKGFVGNFAYIGLRNVGLEPVGSIPHLALMIFKCMFAIITPALIVGAFAERVRFSAMCLFMVLWATFVYDPICYSVWGEGGFLKNIGMLDYAGGTVIHINAGIAALVFALFVGKRNRYPTRIPLPHSLPFAVFGCGVLWVCWLGFNAGNALAANAVATNAFVVTHIGAASAALTWGILDWVFNKKPTLLGLITGAIAGLVATTPASGFVDAQVATPIGAGAGIICYFFVAYIKPKFGYDDSLDVFAVHGAGGTWGAIATGLFANKTIGGADGVFYGNPSQLLIQLQGVLFTAVYSMIVTFILLWLVNKIIKVRVSDHDELVGLDLSDHREIAYTVLE